MKRYGGSRRDGSVIVSVDDDGSGRKVRNLPTRFDLRSHSPTGFQWGYQGSGPAQLALALCADATGDDERALAVYQEVKRILIAGILSDSWTFSVAEVLGVIVGIEQRRAELAARRGEAAT